MINSPAKKGRKISYGEMCRDLMDRIRSGELAPGETLPSENLLSDSFSICRNSVRSGLRSLEKEGLIGCQAGKGWFVRLPDGEEENLSPVKSEICTIGVDFISQNESAGWYDNKLFCSTDLACNRHGIRLTRFSSDNRNYLRPGFCNGVICAKSLMSEKSSDSQLLIRLPELGIFPVAVNRPFENPKLAYVSCDYRAEARHGAEYLLKRGHSRVRYVFAPSNFFPGKDRILGVLDIFPKSGFEECRMMPMCTIEIYTEEIIRDLKENGVPEALFLENGSFALPLFKAFQLLGIRPENTPDILCFDDIDYLAKFFDYPYAFIKMPLDVMAADAVEYLWKKYEDASYPVLKKIYPAELVEISHNI